MRGLLRLFTVAVRNRMGCISKYVLPVFLLSALANSSLAQLILEPGKTYENIPAAGKVIKNTGEQPPPPPNVASSDGLSLSTVSFDRSDSFTQNIRLYAEVNPIFQRKSAVARGILYVDFCVPRSGFDSCATPPDSSAPDVIASITFGYGVVGGVNALGLGSKATFAASGSVIDLDRSAFVNYQNLGELSASLGTIKVIAKVPVPIPDFSQAETTLPVTFTTLLKRGRTYRFQLAGSSGAEGLAGASASSDFYSNANFAIEQGRVQLRNLTIQIGQENSDTAKELEELKALVSSLLGQVGSLGSQIESLRENFQEETSALRQELGDLTQRSDLHDSILLLPVGSETPSGYTYVGNLDLAPSDGPRGRNQMTPVAFFIRDDFASID